MAVTVGSMCVLPYIGASLSLLWKFKINKYANLSYISGICFINPISRAVPTYWQSHIFCYKFAYRSADSNCMDSRFPEP